jgi:3-(3-hydroxy-phenyl)propionate hydroxylase
MAVSNHFDHIMQKPLPILIIGAGPVGLCLALALGRAGIPVAVYEQDDELNSDIRASTFHPPTLEMLAEWGVVDGVMAQGYIVRELAYWERRTRQRIATFDYAAIANDTPFPYRVQCPQHILTRVLKPIVEQLPSATVQMGHRYLHHVDHGTHVAVTFETAQGEQTVTGAYLCGADGSRSAVRQALAMPFEGMTYADRFLLIGTDYDFETVFPEFGAVNYIFDPEEWVIILRLPDLARVVFRLKVDEDEAVAMSEGQLRQRMWRFIGEAVPFNIKTTQLYRVHQRVAAEFRRGRVLLLGDAAHINNPAGGMGMNSGIHDAHALAAVLAHSWPNVDWARLDQWSERRRIVALENVSTYSDKNYTDMAAKDADYRRERNVELAATAADPQLARAYLLRAAMLAERI